MEALEDIFNIFKTNPSIRIVFAKHMARHMIGLDDVLGQREVERNGEIFDVRHVFLVRDPLSMISSWDAKASVHQEKCSLETTCLLHMLRLYSELNGSDQSPVVVDSQILMQEPEEVLNELCIQLQIPFLNSQLSWQSGAKECDGYGNTLSHA